MLIALLLYWGGGAPLKHRKLVAMYSSKSLHSLHWNIE